MSVEQEARELLATELGIAPGEKLEVWHGVSIDAALRVIRAALLRSSASLQDEGVPASPSGSRKSSRKSVSPAVAASIPNAAWRFIDDAEITIPDGTLVYALGRLGDVYGPLPAEMFHPDAWDGDMFHASHDLIAVAICELDWRSAIPLAASAIEARRAATAQTGAVHESAVPKADAQPPSGTPGEQSG